VKRPFILLPVVVLVPVIGFLCYVVHAKGDVTATIKSQWISLSVEARERARDVSPPK
jgi:hypothetical protein